MGLPIARKVCRRAAGRNLVSRIIRYHSPRHLASSKRKSIVGDSTFEVAGMKIRISISNIPEVELKPVLDELDRFPPTMIGRSPDVWISVRGMKQCSLKQVMSGNSEQMVAFLRDGARVHIVSDRLRGSWKGGKHARAHFEVPPVGWGVQSSVLVALVYQGSFSDALLMHGSAAVIEGKGFLFIGPSGAGKTTIAMDLASRGIEILAGEIASVSRCAHNEWIVSAVPFGNVVGAYNLSTSKCAPLCRVMLLDRTKGSGVSKMSSSGITKTLLQNIVGCEMERDGAARTLNSIIKLSTSCPVDSLSYNRNVDWLVKYLEQ